MKYCILLLISFSIFNPHSITVAQHKDLNGFQFLIGEWTGSGGSTGSGQGEGKSVFRYDLDSNVIIRENYAHYPAQNNKPEYTHKDLMVIYLNTDALKAIYIDNEKHVINYKVELIGNDFVFTSDPIKGSTQFRMTYSRVWDDRMTFNFEIAPPNAPGKFNLYLSSELLRNYPK